MKENYAKKVLIAAAFMNISGVLLFSRAFTNQAVNEADPIVMSNFGLLMIIVWGLAYYSAAFLKSNIAGIVGVFALEKLVYVAAWGIWVSNNSLSAVYDTDLFAGLFYSIYGLNDFVFMVLFTQVFFSQRKSYAENPNQRCD